MIPNDAHILVPCVEPYSGDKLHEAMKRCDPTLPAVLGNHGLHPTAYRMMSMYEATGNVDDC